MIAKQFCGPQAYNNLKSIKIHLRKLLMNRVRLLTRNIQYKPIQILGNFITAEKGQ